MGEVTSPSSFARSPSVTSSSSPEGTASQVWAKRRGKWCTTRLRGYNRTNPRFGEGRLFKLGSRTGCRRCEATDGRRDSRVRSIPSAFTLLEQCKAMQRMPGGISHKDWLQLGVGRSDGFGKPVLYKTSCLSPRCPEPTCQHSQEGGGGETSTTYLNTFVFLTTIVCSCAMAGAMLRMYRQECGGGVVMRRRAIVCHSGGPRQPIR